MERLDKIIANRGIASRREVKELVRQGRVLVDGVPASAPDVAGTRSDAVVLSGFGGGYLLPFSSASHKPDRYTAPSARS